MPRPLRRKPPDGYVYANSGAFGDVLYALPPRSRDKPKITDGCILVYQTTFEEAQALGYGVTRYEGETWIALDIGDTARAPYTIHVGTDSFWLRKERP